MDNNAAQIINAIITNLDQLSVTGARNMAIVVNCINALAELKGKLEGDADAVQNPTN